MRDGRTEPPPATPYVPWALFCAALSSTGGVFIAFSALHLARGEPTDHVMTDRRLLGLLGMELVMALFWVPSLIRRGWSMRHVSRGAVPGDVAVGVLLAVGAYAGYWLTFVVTAIISPGYARAASSIHIGGSVSLWVAALLAVINPVAEEFFYLGFVANVLRPRGAPLAIAASIALRVLVHLYQGPIGVIASLPIGALFGGYYLAARRIWPAVIAHSLLDAVALIGLVQ
jgi:membrane protease YdiL (CAAX protease family)